MGSLLERNFEDQVTTLLKKHYQKNLSECLAVIKQQAEVLQNNRKIRETLLDVLKNDLVKKHENPTFIIEDAIKMLKSFPNTKAQAIVTAALDRMKDAESLKRNIQRKI